jgi:hypothetical protein
MNDRFREDAFRRCVCGLSTLHWTRRIVLRLRLSGKSATRSLASAAANNSFRIEAQAARRGFFGRLYG